jgi:hypothetical protein
MILGVWAYALILGVGLNRRAPHQSPSATPITMEKNADNGAPGQSQWERMLITELQGYHNGKE